MPDSATLAKGFRTPSGNIFCFIDQFFAVCVMGSANFDVPDDVCPDDPTVVAQLDAGSTIPGIAGCAGEAVPPHSSPIAPYGTKVSAHGSSCTVNTDGVRCRNKAGGFFGLSRDRFFWSDDGK